MISEKEVTCLIWISPFDTSKRRKEQKIHKNYLGEYAMKKALTVLVVLAFGGASLTAETLSGKLPTRVNPENAVVYLEGVDVNNAPNPVTEQIDQKNLEFIPHLLAVPKDSTVQFSNSDNVTHNVFGIGAHSFNLGNWEPGETRKEAMNNSGEVIVLCNLHPEMSAYIRVFEHPFFAKPKPDGTYRIEGVPAGTYQLVIYQPEKDPIKTTVRTGE